MTTTLSFTDRSSEDASAASMDFNTASWPNLRVMISNLNGSRVSRLGSTERVREDRTTASGERKVPDVEMSQPILYQRWQTSMEYDSVRGHSDRL